MTKKRSTKKGGTKGKAEGSKIRLSKPATVRRVFKLNKEDGSTSASYVCLGDIINDLLQYADANEFSPEIFRAPSRWPPGASSASQATSPRRQRKPTKNWPQSSRASTRARRWTRSRRASGEVSPKHFEQYQQDGAFFAGILADPACPEGFRKLFAAVFASDMLGRVDLGNPHLLPLTFPIIRDTMDASNACGTADIEGEYVGTACEVGLGSGRLLCVRDSTHGIDYY